MKSFIILHRQLLEMTSDRLSNTHPREQRLGCSSSNLCD